MKVMVKTENQSLEAIISSSFFQELCNCQRQVELNS